MSSLEIDGVVVPVGVGGHPALDFCNTRAGWVIDTPKEYLHSHRHLTVWARFAGLLSPEAERSSLRAARRSSESAAAAEAVNGAAIDLRTCLYDVLVGDRSDAAWEHVAAAASAADALAELSAPAPVARWRLPDDLGVGLPLLAVALAAAELLTSPLVTSVSACPMTDCGWLFADPRGRRTWCSMAVCGNRAKVRRYAAKRRA